MKHPFIPLKERRMANGVTLVTIAAKAGCSIGYVRQYEIDPNSLGDARKRARLDEIYGRLTEDGKAA